MTNRKAVISSAIYIEGKTITEDEKRENKAKFEVWFDDFINRYGGANEKRN